VDCIRESTVQLFSYHGQEQCHLANIEQAAAKQMVRENKKKGKIVLVSSTLGYMSLIGYSSYSPAKHALRGE
jgi:short-subunit dehydrogenase